MPTTPAQMLARYRQLGVTWVIVQNGGALAGDKQVAALVERYGQLEYRDRDGVGVPAHADAGPAGGVRRCARCRDRALDRPGLHG